MKKIFSIMFVLLFAISCASGGGHGHMNCDKCAGKCDKCECTCKHGKEEKKDNSQPQPTGGIKK